ncbi:MAG: hypothetical protein E7343_01770 [Clostridiales bacterium]|nr:hypothetical protein [Clostridiales bacterium]
MLALLVLLVSNAKHKLGRLRVRTTKPQKKDRKTRYNGTLLLVSNAKQRLGWLTRRQLPSVAER